MKNKLKDKSILAIVLLFIASFLWGLAFVFQSLGMENIGPISFNMMRFLVGGIFLIPIYLIKNRNKKITLKDERIRHSIEGGLVIGIILFFAAMSQQISLLYTSVAKVGFIAVLYIVIIPIIHFFMGDRISKKIVFCIIISIIGLYFLTMKGDFNISYGDILALISSFIYAFHIIFISKYTAKGDSILLTMIHFLVAGSLSMICAIIIEKPQLMDILKSYKAIIYTGVFASGIGYSLQVFSQRHLSSTLASLIMSSEAVFAAFCAYFILAQKMSLKEFVGCIFVLVATIFAQIPEKTKRKANLNLEKN